MKIICIIENDDTNKVELVISENPNDNIESIERCLKKVQTDSEKEALNSYHQELLKNKNERKDDNP